MLDPLSVIDFIFNKVGISINDQDIKDYWGHYRSEEISAKWACEHPASNNSIPCGLYGDGCKIREYQKMVGIFLNLPLFRPRSIRCSRFLLVAFQEELVFQRKTLDAIWRHIVWRMNLLLSGRWPNCDIDGHPLSGPQLSRAGQEVVTGKTFAVTELRGDWLWLKQCLSFRSSWKGGVHVPVCFMCEAGSNEPFLYYNVQKDSNEWDTEYSTFADFLVMQMPQQPSY